MKTLVIGKGKSGEAAACLLAQRGDDVTFAEGYDRVVTSPGVPVVSELQLGVEALRAAGVRLLAVTGSKGKSSVVKLVAEALGGVPCGNYGLPVSTVAREGGVTWAVVEVSSFQLETTHLPPNAFEAAALLNLQEDHLDRHGSAAVYHALKRGLLGMAKVAFGPDELQTLAEHADVQRLLHGSYFDNEILRPNGAAAIALLRQAGLSDETIAAAFAAFQPLPHRMNLVGVCNGVRFVDDSKATSLAALAAGVTMSGVAVRLIAGGLPKGDDVNSVVPLLTKRVKKVYLIGRSAETFFSAWHQAVDCEVCGDLVRAVERATCEAVAGDTVLLSPGAASFDQFRNFEERGETFAQLVKQERQKR